MATAIINGTTHYLTRASGDGDCLWNAFALHLSTKILNDGLKTHETEPGVQQFLAQFKKFHPKFEPATLATLKEWLKQYPSNRDRELLFTPVLKRWYGNVFLPQPDNLAELKEIFINELVSLVDQLKKQHKTKVTDPEYANLLAARTSDKFTHLPEIARMIKSFLNTFLSSLQVRRHAREYKADINNLLATLPSSENYWQAVWKTYQSSIINQNAASSADVLLDIAAALRCNIHEDMPGVGYDNVGSVAHDPSFSNVYLRHEGAHWDLATTDRAQAEQTSVSHPSKIVAQFTGRLSDYRSGSEPLPGLHVKVLIKWLDQALQRHWQSIKTADETDITFTADKTCFLAKTKVPGSGKEISLHGNPEGISFQGADNEADLKHATKRSLRLVLASHLGVNPDGSLKAPTRAFELEMKPTGDVKQQQGIQAAITEMQTELKTAGMNNINLVVIPDETPVNVSAESVTKIFTP